MPHPLPHDFNPERRVIFFFHFAQRPAAITLWEWPIQQEALPKYVESQREPISAYLL